MPRHGNTQRMGAAPPGTGTPRGERGSTAAALTASSPLHSLQQRTREPPALPQRQPSSRSSHIQSLTICPKGWLNTGALCPGLCCLHCRGPSLCRLHPHPALRDTAALLQAEFTPQATPLGPAKGHTRLGRDCGHPRERCRSHLYCLALSMYSCCSMPWESAADTSMMLLQRHKTVAPTGGDHCSP